MPPLSTTPVQLAASLQQTKLSSVKESGLTTFTALSTTENDTFTFGGGGQTSLKFGEETTTTETTEETDDVKEIFEKEAEKLEDLLEELKK